MVLKVFTKEDAPEMRNAIELGKEIEADGFKVEYFDAEDEVSTNQLEIFDIYSFPSFVVARDDDAEIECWRGKVPLKYDLVNFLNR